MLEGLKAKEAEKITLAEERKMKINERRRRKNKDKETKSEKLRREKKESKRKLNRKSCQDPPEGRKTSADCQSQSALMQGMKIILSVHFVKFFYKDDVTGNSWVCYDNCNGTVINVLV